MRGEQTQLIQVGPAKMSEALHYHSKEIEKGPIPCEQLPIIINNKVYTLDSIIGAGASATIFRVFDENGSNKVVKVAKGALIRNNLPVGYDSSTGMSISLEELRELPDNIATDPTTGVKSNGFNLNNPLRLINELKAKSLLDPDSDSSLCVIPVQNGNRTHFHLGLVMEEIAGDQVLANMDFLPEAIKDKKFQNLLDVIRELEPIIPSLDEYQRVNIAFNLINRSKQSVGMISKFHQLLNSPIRDISADVFAFKPGSSTLQDLGLALLNIDDTHYGGSIHAKHQYFDVSIYSGKDLGTGKTPESPLSDIFACSVILLQILSGKHGVLDRPDIRTIQSETRHISTMKYPPNHLGGLNSIFGDLIVDFAMLGIIYDHEKRIQNASMLWDLTYDMLDVAINHQGVTIPFELAHIAIESRKDNTGSVGVKRVKNILNHLELTTLFANNLKYRDNLFSRICFDKNKDNYSDEEKNDFLAKQLLPRLPQG